MTFFKKKHTVLFQYIALPCIIFSAICNAEEPNYAEIHYRIYEIERYSIDSLQDYAGAYTELNRILRSCDYRFDEAYQLALHNIFCNLDGSWETYEEDIKFYIERLSSIYQRATLNMWLVNYTKRSCRKPPIKHHKELSLRPGLSIFCWGCASPQTKNQMKEYIKLCFKNALNKPKLDQQITRELLQMEKRDQQARNIRNIQKSDAVMETIDLQNREKMDTIIARYQKIPGIREVGNAGMSAIEIILSHIGYDWIHKNMQHIERGIISGDLDPERMAWIVDYNWHQKHLAFIDGKMRIPYCQYGSLISSEAEATPVKNISHTNRIRKHWGLPPVEYYWQQHCIKFSDEKDFLQKHRFELFEPNKY